MKCAACGEPADGWPANDGGELCQMCWELECSEDWWRLVAESEDWWPAALVHCLR